MRIDISGDSQAAILEKLREVKEDVVTNLDSVDVAFEEPIIRATIDLLRRVASRDRRVTTMAFYNCSGPFELIILEGLALQLVSEIKVNGWSRLDSPLTSPPSAIFPALCWGIQCRHLEAVRFDNLILPTRELAEFLTTVLVGSNHLKELNLIRIGFTEDEDEDKEHVISALVAGLRHNTSLQELVLGDLGGDLDDVQAARMVDALEMHSSLRRLALLKFDCGIQTTQALIKLLLKNHKLTDLEINKCHPSPTCIDSVTKSLRGHPCLERLDLIGNDLTDEELNLGSLVEILSTCPKLERLDLESNNFTCDGLKVLASHPLPSSLRWLNLTNNNFDEEESPCHILTILQHNPKLTFVDFDVEGEAELVVHQKIDHLMDVNESGKYLLSDGAVIPLSLWSLVLARANTLFYDFQPSESIASKRANVIFHLLQGPALMQRRFDLEASHQPRLGQKCAAAFGLLQERSQQNQHICSVM